MARQHDKWETVIRVTETAESRRVFYAIGVSPEDAEAEVRKLPGIPQWRSEIEQLHAPRAGGYGLYKVTMRPQR